ncbi:hypothetical protein BH24PSE2_BH24PSE2_06270 [soil metagenome]
MRGGRTGVPGSATQSRGRHAARAPGSACNDSDGMTGLLPDDRPLRQPGESGLSRGAVRAPPRRLRPPAICDLLSERWEPADKPGSVGGNHSSGMRVAAHLERPTREPVRATPAAYRRALPYLVLLRVGFALPRRVTTRAVRSYRTISPLPAERHVRQAVCFLLHFPWTRVPQALPGTLPCGARTFLRLSQRRLPGRLPSITLPWSIPDRPESSALPAPADRGSPCSVSAPGRRCPWLVDTRRCVSHPSGGPSTERPGRAATPQAIFAALPRPSHPRVHRQPRRGRR